MADSRQTGKNNVYQTHQLTMMSIFFTKFQQRLQLLYHAVRLKMHW